MLVQRVINNLKAVSFRTFSINATKRSAYESDGKTVVSIMNSEPGLGIMVDAISEVGFRLNNGVFIVGPVAMFRKFVLSWNIRSDADINEESLHLFTTLEPKLDMLVVGCADPSESFPLRKRLISFYNKHKINLEVLPTEKAVATFNFLTNEKRYVAAALIPPLKVVVN